MLLVLALAPPCDMGHVATATSKIIGRIVGWMIFTWLVPIKIHRVTLGGDSVSFTVPLNVNMCRGDVKTLVNPTATSAAAAGLPEPSSHPLYIWGGVGWHRGMPVNVVLLIQLRGPN